MDQISKNLGIIIQLITLLGVLFAVYKSLSKPQAQDEQEIALIKQGCFMRHQNIDQDISLIKTNHLAHIEKDISFLKEKHVELFTMLNERLPKKD